MVDGKVLGKVAAIGLDVLKFVASGRHRRLPLPARPPPRRRGRAFASRLIAPRGAHFVNLAGATIRNVSRGVIGVALLQALLAEAILYLAGIPGAGLIAFGVLLLCIVQIGAPVLLPVLVWIWMTHPTTFSIVLTLLLVPVGLVDNVLMPILMARGLTTPMLVILTGGTLTHGLVGLISARSCSRSSTSSSWPGPGLAESLQWPPPQTVGSHDSPLSRIWSRVMEHPAKNPAALHHLPSLVTGPDLRRSRRRASRLRG